MPEPIFFLSHFRIKEGQLDVVRRIASEGAARLHAEKPRTVLFLSYLDADGGTISFLHAFADPESMDMHIVGADERSRAASEYIEPLGWEVYGNPNPVALETLRQAADSAGRALVRHPEYLAGFLRLELGQQTADRLAGQLDEAAEGYAMDTDAAVAYAHDDGA